MQIHICFTDFNTVKSSFEKFEFDMNLKNENNNKQTTEETMDFEINRENDKDSFELADFVFESDGSFTVALTNFNINSLIYLYKVNQLKKKEDNL